MSRSLKDVLHIMVRIAEAGAAFRSISECIDTTTPAGHTMMRMGYTFADFDCSMISERTIAGLAAACAEWRVVGRPRRLLGIDAGLDLASFLNWPAAHPRPSSTSTLCQQLRALQLG